MATTILLLRHAHTASNATGLDVRMSGWTDVALSDAGRREAAVVARQIANTMQPHALITSSLTRAVQTAREIERGCGIEACIEPCLREIGCGNVDGLTLAQVQQSYPDAWRRNLLQCDPDFRWPAGESYREFRERVLRTLERIARTFPGERTVVVTHAGVISQVVGFLNGRSAAEWSSFRPRNCSITELVWSDAGPRVVAFDVLPSELAR
ncbi:MAG TPA: histidine phosphatase family protein [Polyangiales bacterium]|nr:histidine phosphatase family protein [Polyangiales bacterium]